MLKREIKLTSYDIGEDEISFEMQASNDRNASSVYFYGQASIFKKFADELLRFPERLDSEITFEHRQNGYYSIYLRVFCHNNNGHAAIQVKVFSWEGWEDKDIEYSAGEFCILTVPAAVNKLGRMLQNWDPLTCCELIWSADD